MKSNKFSSYFVEALSRAMKLTETKTNLSLSTIINRKSKTSSVQTKLTINTIECHIKKPIKILNPYSYFQK